MNLLRNLLVMMCMINSTLYVSFDLGQCCNYKCTARTSAGAVMTTEIVFVFVLDELSGILALYWIVLCFALEKMYATLTLALWCFLMLCLFCFVILPCSMHQLCINKESSTLKCCHHIGTVATHMDWHHGDRPLSEPMMK